MFEMNIIGLIFCSLTATCGRKSEGAKWNYYDKEHYKSWYAQLKVALINVIAT